MSIDPQTATAIGFDLRILQDVLARAPHADPQMGWPADNAAFLVNVLTGLRARLQAGPDALQQADLPLIMMLRFYNKETQQLSAHLQAAHGQLAAYRRG